MKCIPAAVKIYSVKFEWLLLIMILHKEDSFTSTKLLPFIDKFSKLERFFKSPLSSL